MYAVTATGYRAIASADDLLPGEAFALEVPAEVVHAAKADEYRSIRNTLLRDSDWAVLPDTPLSEVQSTAWRAYRQTLRDLPQQPDFPDCPWPQPPVRDPSSSMEQGETE